MTTVPGVVPQDAKRSMRKHGEGNLTLLSDGRWRGRIMLGRKPDGKPDRPWVYGSTQREVLKDSRAIAGCGVVIVADPRDGGRRSKVRRRC